jgi:polar amino acid transport system substrate-binding protein
MTTPFAVALVATALVLAGCASGTSAGDVPDGCVAQHRIDTVHEGQLRVSGFVSPPSVLSGDGPQAALTGIDSDIIHQFARNNCLAVVEKTSSAAAGVGDLGSGRIDILIGGIGFTPERAEAFGASHPMYTQRMVVISESGVRTVDEMASTDGVGVVQGYRWQEDLERALGSIVKVYQSREAMLSDLQSGRIAVATLDEGEAHYSLEQLGRSDLTVEPVAADKRVAASLEPSRVVVLYTKGNGSLGDALNSQIDDMLASGAMAKLLTEYGLDPAGSGRAG